MNSAKRFLATWGGNGDRKIVGDATIEAASASQRPVVLPPCPMEDASVVSLLEWRLRFCRTQAGLLVYPTMLDFGPVSGDQIQHVLKVFEAGQTIMPDFCWPNFWSWNKCVLNRPTNLTRTYLWPSVRRSYNHYEIFNLLLRQKLMYTMLLFYIVCAYFKRYLHLW